jgi:hypothetical protein
MEQRARIGAMLMRQACAQARLTGYKKRPLPENPFLHVRGRSD